MSQDQHQHHQHHHQQSILVVGSGIAGLTAAHLLSAEYNVTLVERAHTLGMDQSSVEFAGGRIDVPLRTFNLDYYPNLSSLYSELGVSFAVADYSFCCFERGMPQAYFRFYNTLEPMLTWLVGSDKISLPVLRLSTLRYVGEYIRFIWNGPKDLRTGVCRGITFKEYCLARFSPEFYWRVLMPWLSVVCTCSFEGVSNYPAEILMDYIVGRRGSLFGNSMQRATAGTADVVARFSSRCSKVLLGCSVREIVPKKSPTEKVHVSWGDSKGHVMSESFDHVVLATQANSALESLIKHCSTDVKETLASVVYERNTTVLHLDETILPSMPDDRSTVCLAVSSDLSASDCTIWMNKVDKHMAQLSQDVYQTWNPICSIAESKIVAQFEFERPVLTLSSETVLAGLSEVNGKDGVWFVGAYTLYTMPLLESGVRSAIRVANNLLKQKREEKGAILREVYCDAPEKQMHFAEKKLSTLVVLTGLGLVGASALVWMNKKQA